MGRLQLIGIISKGGFSLAILVALCVSCTSKNNNKYNYKYGKLNEAVIQNMQKDTMGNPDDVRLINIDCNYEYKEAGFLFHDLKLIPLETSSKSLIGEVDKIMIQDSFVYLLDVNKAKSLLVFNLNSGKFLRKIGNYGKSNSEYIEPTDFTVDGNHVIILDNRSTKLLIFDIEGNFKEVSRLQFALQTIERTGVDSVFIGIAGDNRHIDAIHKYKILKFNTHGNILSKHLKMDYSINFCELNNLKYELGRFWYHAPFSNNIVFLDGLVTEVKYKFQFSKVGIPDDFVKRCNENYENFIEKYRRSHSYVQNVSCYTNRYMISQYADEGRNGCLLVYDMISDRIIFNGVPTFDSQEGTIKDFLAMRFGGKSPLFAVEGDRIYGMIPAESLGVLDSNEKIKGLLKKGTLSNDNPILFSVDIKENFD
ncbi:MULTISPECIES: 6-bladed beta-propeller [Odoribacteraceae]|uniref:6-bladed beta-propeller n=1 Tax=Odoribacteraceae TaxID=1853231 RepID=UPI000E518196|nr:MULTISPECIES: 6-bladed beta-propeller [Odoribacteraceae]MCQ4875339.1 6-bladed beta-propeller [Butyricimonas paravirosa]